MPRLLPLALLTVAAAGLIFAVATLPTHTPVLEVVCESGTFETITPRDGYAVARATCHVGTVAGRTVVVTIID